ncbi:unnamed protein product [Ceutorhynchus assimilis]|uniref:Sine oculis-binding protein homolog n=1 Tax=Ceutorhynchus assimilis TaxID=467358 RepID=A0A9N9MSH5_9CUCU|nr:unnamed protein product [Ceutorhynchus assimilis]
MEKNKNNEVSITKVSVKKSDELKSLAESTMNELLGWYGYECPKQEAKDSKARRSSRSFSGSNDSEGESVKFTEGCGWCGKTVDENTSVISATAIFCSELCFSQSRRASFKKNKTCDWCRHSRPGISYVDIQDNATQLQFCSDKCLNQYKMHIFCRETQAHLDLHPHLHGSETATGNLITPDLWLKSCTSPIPNRESPSLSLNPIETLNQNSKKSPLPMPEPLPIISVAPSTKLLATDTKRNRTKTNKRFKKLSSCPSTITSPINYMPSFSDIPEDLRVRQTPPAEELLESFDIKTNLKKESSIRTSLDEPRADLQHQDPKLTSDNIRAILGNFLPPPTTFVPYPVILPLPIPIPIPIPIPKMFRVNKEKEIIELKDNNTQTDDINILNIINNNNNIILEKRFDTEKDNISEQVTTSASKRLLRKRKQVDKKSKIYLKPKKALSSLP